MLEFVHDFHAELHNTQNQRLQQFIQLVATLNQGCGCTRRQRGQMAEQEYVAIGTYLSADNIGVIKAKYQDHTIEFANNGAVFFIID